jgi:TRAP-type C4-dicarboxylate transport system permease small subunit
MTFLGTAWLLRKEGHVEMDIVTITLSTDAQRILKIATSLVAGLLCLVLMWSGAEVALDHLMRGLHQPTLLAPPDFPLFAIIPVGFLLLSIQFLRRAHNHLVVKEPKEEKERVMV